MATEYNWPDPCPTCGAEMGIAEKRTAKSPDYKCTNEHCKGGKDRKYPFAAWADRGNGAQQRAPRHNGAPTPNRAPTGGPRYQSPARSAPGKPSSWTSLAANYSRAKEIAVKTWAGSPTAADPSAIVAATATVFIQAMQAGLTVAPPAPPPPPRPDEADEWIPVEDGSY